VSESLVVLATQYVELHSQHVTIAERLQAIRNDMKRLLANGAGDGKPRPTAAHRPSGKRPSRSAALAESQAKDEQVLSLLSEQPMRLVEVIKTTSAKGSTTQARLHRLADRNLVRCDDGLWSATAAG
jgi:hypothetical protein